MAEEHFLSVYLRNKLGARFHHRQPRSKGPRLLAACLPGDHHETGLLLFALGAHDQGYRLVLLGADMPLQDIPPVTQQIAIDAVVLSGTLPPESGVISRQLPELVRRVQVPVFVGGQVAASHATDLKTAGAIPVGADLVTGLHQLNGHLNRPPMTTLRTVR